MSGRKYIRIALTESDQGAFDAAKERAEAATGIAMADSMFALSLIRRSIRMEDDKK